MCYFSDKTTIPYVYSQKYLEKNHRLFFLIYNKKNREKAKEQVSEELL